MMTRFKISVWCCAVALFSVTAIAVGTESMAYAQPAKTSSTTVAPTPGPAPAADAAASQPSAPAQKLPEEGGVLPRAPMPEGSAEPAPPPPPPPPPPMGTDEQLTSTSEGDSDLQVMWGGYLRVVGRIVENDPSSVFVGRNDGFQIGNARIAMSARYAESLLGYISIEASVADSDDLNDPNAHLAVGPRDAFLSYDVSRQASIRFGRFKAPYDIGALESSGTRTFVDSPIESRGVAPTEGFEVDGMSQGRQLGVMLHRGRLGISDDGFDMGYALALTNGRTESLAFNDNDRPAGFVRLSMLYGKCVQLHLGGFTDTRTVGELPNLFDEEVKGGEASVVVTLDDLRIEAQGLFQRTNFPTSGAEVVNAVGGHAQWAYRFMNIEFAYRFGYFDPNSLFENDAISEHTIGLSYFAKTVPLRFALNGVIVNEQDGRKLENNRITLLTQYTF